MPLPQWRNWELKATKFTYPDPDHPGDDITYFMVVGNPGGDEAWRSQLVVTVYTPDTNRYGLRQISMGSPYPASLTEQDLDALGIIER